MGWDAVFHLIHSCQSNSNRQHNYHRRKSYNKSERNVLAKARKQQELFDLNEKLQGEIQYEKGMILEVKQPVKKEI